MAVEFSANTTPPPSRAGKTTPRPTRRAETVKTKRAEREEGVLGLFQTVQLGLVMGGQFSDSGAVAIHGPKIAAEAADLAESNERVGKALDYLSAVGPFAALFSACMPLLLQLLVNHEKIPAHPVLSQVGVMDPKAMEATARAHMMRQAQAALQEQADAEAELAEMMHAQARREAQQKLREANGRPTPTDIPVRP